jgi:hypothetical protein
VEGEEVDIVDSGSRAVSRAQPPIEDVSPRSGSTGGGNRGGNEGSPSCPPPPAGSIAHCPRSSQSLSVQFSLPSEISSEVNLFLRPVDIGAFSTDVATTDTVCLQTAFGIHAGGIGVLSISRARQSRMNILRMYGNRAKPARRQHDNSGNRRLLIAFDSRNEEDDLLFSGSLASFNSARLEPCPDDPCRKLPKPSGGGSRTFLNADLHSVEAKP